MNNPLDPPPGNFQIPLVDDTETSNASVHPSNKDDLSARDVTLYGVLGVLFGSLLSGGFAYYDTHPMFGVILALIGAIGLAVMAILLIRYRLKIIHAFITAIAALVATWVVLGYVLWTKPKEVVVHDRPTVEDVAKATESITAERDTEKQRAESATQQLAKYQTLYPALQSNLAAATTERDALRKTQDGLTQELNSIRAQLGPKSTILGLDNAKRWELYTAIE